MQIVRKARLWLSAALAAWAALPEGTVLAQEGVGEARDSLPGIVNVPVAGTFDRTGVAFAASAGYGYTESALGRGDHHDRLLGTLAASVRPLPWLAFALRLDGRYDHDFDPGPGPNAGSSAGASSTGLVGDPRLFVRAGADLSHGFRIGAQLGLWVPGDHAPSLVFDAATLDAIVMAAYAPPGSPLVLAVHAGGRWDNSAKSVPDAARLSESERLGLGINGASGVLSGIGASLHVARRVELLADVSADWLVGRGAPTALESPIVIGVGGRWATNERRTFSLQLLLDVSPSQRPDVAAGQPLVDVEPRVSASLGLVFRPGGAAEAPAPEPAPAEETPAPEVTAALPTQIATSVKGRVTSAAGTPLAHAQVRLTAFGQEARAAESDGDGSFEFKDVPFGVAALEVSATGYGTGKKDVTVDASGAAVVTMALDPAIPPAQIRGLVRDFAGKPVAASVVIEPLDGKPPVTATLRADGGFEVDVQPGTYNVAVTARGYAPQRRKVVVEPQGVTLLNIDLRGAR